MHIPSKRFQLKEIKCNYFLNKKEKHFYQIHGNFRKNQEYPQDQFNTDLRYSKKYLKAEKKYGKEVFNIYMQQ